MQSVGMRGVGRFFRNATKTQTKSSIKRQKSIVHEERENMPKNGVCLSKRRRKNNGREWDGKNDVGVRHCWNKKALVIYPHILRDKTIKYHKIPHGSPYFLLTLLDYHFLVSAVIKYGSTSTIVIVVLKKTHTNNTFPSYLLNFIHIHGLITLNVSADHLASLWQVNYWCNWSQRSRAFLQERNPTSRKKNKKARARQKEVFLVQTSKKRKKTRWQIVRKTKSVHVLLAEMKIH